MRPESTSVATMTPVVSRRISFACLAAIGIMFWFVVGFPFGNHNESYYWVSFFAHHSLWDAVRDPHLAVTLRPLGQALAYLGWCIAGGSSWPIQIFNFVIAAMAIYSIALATTETATFAVAMGVTGATFFAGFIYLFHIHGVFYSPILLIIAMLLHLDRAGNRKDAHRELVAFAAALLVGLLFHPYALILFLAFWCGRTIERWIGLSRWQRSAQAVVVLVMVIAVMASRPSWHHVLLSTSVQGLLTSCRMNETAPVLSILAAAFSALTAFSIESIALRFRIGLAVAAIVCAIGFASLGLPVIMLWIATAILKLVYMRRWPLAMMTCAAALLPGISPSGSPTYAIFAVILSVFALVDGFTAAEHALEHVDSRFAAAVIVLALSVGGALRLGVRIPAVSRVARPLIAEREKTWQLEAVVNWLLASPYRNWNLQLDNVVNPIDSEAAAANRAYRPPTNQGYLDAYLLARRADSNDPHTLVVTFGGRGVPTMTRVYSVAGPIAGPAMVFKTAATE